MLTYTQPSQTMLIAHLEPEVKSERVVSLSASHCHQATIAMLSSFGSQLVRVIVVVAWHPKGLHQGNYIPYEHA